MCFSILIIPVVSGENPWDADIIGDDDNAITYSIQPPRADTSSIMVDNTTINSEPNDSFTRSMNINFYRIFSSTLINIFYRDLLINNVKGIEERNPINYKDNLREEKKYSDSY
jgi:hypothetical protein